MYCSSFNTDHYPERNLMYFLSCQVADSWVQNWGDIFMAIKIVIAFFLHQLSPEILHSLNLVWELKWIMAVLITALYLRGNTTSVFFPSPDFWKLGLINPQIPSSIWTNSKVSHNKWIRVIQWIGYVIFWWVCWIGWCQHRQLNASA